MELPDLPAQAAAAMSGRVVRTERRPTTARAMMALAAALVLALPAVLAFLSGGYFATGRSLGLIFAFVALAICAVFAPMPLPTSLDGRLALAGLAAFCLVTAALGPMAPAIGPAFADFQRVLLYLVYLSAAIAVLSVLPLRRLAMPALLLGAFFVCVYAILGRCLPTVIEQTDSIAAQGRLEQPISYWNALGIYAGLGVVMAAGICARAAGRPRVRAACAASLPWTGATVALTLSRGAIAATLIGLLLVAAISRTRAAVAWCSIAAAVALLSGLASLAFPSLREAVREPAAVQPAGLALFGILVALTVVAGAAACALRASEMPVGRWAAISLATLLAITVVGVPVLIATSQTDSGAPAGGRSGAVAGRLVSAQGSRLTYWEVALRAFAASPVTGEGPSSFRVRWLRERPFPEAANDAHSLYVETAAELGLLGLLALFTFGAGALLGAVRASRIDPAAAAPVVGVLGAFLVHAGLDWDWEVPTVTLVALTAVGMLVTFPGDHESDE